LPQKNWGGGACANPLRTGEESVVGSPAGIVQSQCRPRKTQVFKTDFPKSDPVSRQAVALGGNPLKRKTGMVGEEGDRSGCEPE
jgi:hypothetical protein